MRSAKVLLIVAVLIVAAVAAAVPHVAASEVRVGPASLVAHAPIDIEGDANFTATNGVVSGSGSAADPYVIAGWAISAPPGIGVQLRNTAAHAVVRDVEVTAASVAGFYAFSVSNVTLANVTAYAGLGEGVRVESSHHIVVEASSLIGNVAGAAILDSSDVAVRGNNVTLNTADGIAVSASPFATIQDNNVSLNGIANTGYGVHLASTTNDTVTGNRFFRNGIYVDGSVREHFDSHTIPADNLVFGLPILYERDCNGLDLTGLVLGGLLVANCLHAQLSNLTVSGGDVGIELAFSRDVTIGPNVTISDAATGIRTYEASALHVVDSAVLDAGFGILLEASSDVRISGSKVSAPASLIPPADGIAIHASDTVNLTGNVIRHYRNGVETENSGNISLLGNVVELNTAGLNAVRSQDLLALGNLFVRDGSGIRLLGVVNATLEGNGVLGAFTDGANVSGSTGVRVAHNEFSGNAENAHDDLPAGNAWDGGYPAGGNFWGNYRGFDAYQGPLQNVAGADGIGDTQYLFPVNAVDRYPLMLTPVSMDVPPEALFSVSPGAGNVRTVFSVSANVSSDYEDAVGRLQVRWAWDDRAAWGAWTTPKYASHGYATPGDHAIRLEVRDTAGLTDNWTWTVSVSPKPDSLPPAIVHTPPASVEVGHAIRIVANVSDASGIANVTLLFRGVSDAGFTAVPMGYANGTNYAATIPGQPSAGTLEYVIVANDSWGNVARAPVSGVASVQVVDTRTPLVVVAAIVAGVAVLGAVVLVMRRRRRRQPPGAEPTQEPATLK